MKDTCLALRGLFLNKVNVHINMFCTLMLHGVSVKVDNTNIIPIHQSSLRKWVVKLQEKVVKPTRFRNHISNTLVVNFCTRALKHGLSFERPGNEVVTKKHTISRSGTTSVRTCIPINIHIGDKFLNWGRIDIQIIVKGALIILHDAFDGKHVVSARGVHVMTHMLNILRDVRVGEGKILQGSC